MSFIETRFPTTIRFRLAGGASFKTDVVIVDSGQEYRNQNWSQARRKYEASHENTLAADFATLQAFFQAVGGMANGFRFKDFADYKHNDAGGSGGVFTMLTATTFQMWKRYAWGATTYDRKIQKPVSGSVAVTGGTGASVDTTTGIVTVASGTPTSWTGQFDVPVRLDGDDMQGEIVDSAGAQFIMSWSSIKLIEIRV